jgi:hypothetical protein
VFKSWAARKVCRKSLVSGVWRFRWRIMRWSESSSWFLIKRSNVPRPNALRSFKSKSIAPKPKGGLRTQPRVSTRFQSWEPPPRSMRPEAEGRQTKRTNNAAVESICSTSQLHQSTLRKYTSEIRLLPSRPFFRVPKVSILIFVHIPGERRIFGKHRAMARTEHRLEAYATLLSGLSSDLSEPPQELSPCTRTANAMA